MTVFAHFFRRAVAAGIDLFLILIAVMALREGNVGVGFSYEKEIFTFFFRGGLELLLISSLYYLICESLWGRTLGKKLLGLEVISVSSKTSKAAPVDLAAGKSVAKITPVQAFLRTLIRPLDFLFFGLGSIFLSPTYQRLGDRVAKTIVVRANQPDASTEPSTRRKPHLLSKALGVLLLCAGVASSVAIALHVPIIFQINRSGQHYLNTLAKAYLTGEVEPLYELLPTERKKVLPFQKFQAQVMLSYQEKLVEYENQFSDTDFYQWQFFQDKAIAKGYLKDGREVSLGLQQEGSDWKVAVVEIKNPQAK